MDLKKPTRIETVQKLIPQTSFELSDLPSVLTPSFEQKDNKTLNTGKYQRVVNTDELSIYVYAFPHTTSAKKATIESLELDGSITQSCSLTDCIPSLQPGSLYPRFTISNRGVGEADHVSAIESAIEETKKVTKQETKKKLMERANSLGLVTDDLFQSDDDEEESITVVTVGFIVLDENDITKIVYNKITQHYPHWEVIRDKSNEGKLKYSRFHLSKEDLGIFGNYEEICILTIIPESISLEAKRLTKDAKSPAAKNQLMANMTKTSTELAMKLIKSRQNFRTITVIGLILDYQVDKVTKVFVAKFDYITRDSHWKECPECSEPIDEMIARVSMHFNSLHSAINL